MTKEIGQNITNNHIRYDLEIIANLIEPNSKVLDVGCANGELLYFLKQNKKADGRGLEISQEKVSKALAKGISAIQGNAEDDLNCYPDNSFDYAILSQTIQATNKPKEILEEILRISKYAIVSLPNFAHFKNRFHLLFKGMMPVSKTIPFQWFETPNIHFCSIKDFEKLCHDSKIKIQKKVFLTSKKQLPKFLHNSNIANIFAEYGIFLISKDNLSATGAEEFTQEFNFNNSKNISLKPVTCLSPIKALKE